MRSDGFVVQLIKALSRETPASLGASTRAITRDELEGDDVPEQQRTKRLNRAAISILTILTILAITGSLIAFQQYRNAIQQRDYAIANQIIAQADRLRSTDVSLAAQLDLTAYRMRPTPGLYTALVTTENAALSIPLTGHIDSVSSVAFSPDGHTMASGSADQT
ncbi:MAG: hypothetical protein DLM61_14530, partial [Pseudonocardiales bacterium]